MSLCILLAVNNITSYSLSWLLYIFLQYLLLSKLLIYFNRIPGEEKTNFSVLYSLHKDSSFAGKEGPYIPFQCPQCLKIRDKWLLVWNLQQSITVIPLYPPPPLFSSSMVFTAARVANSAKLGFGACNMLLGFFQGILSISKLSVFLKCFTGRNINIFSSIHSSSI